MNRLLSFDDCDKLECLILRFKQTSAVLNLILKHLDGHSHFNEYFNELLDLGKEMELHVDSLSEIVDKIVLEGPCEADEARRADIA